MTRKRKVNFLIFRWAIFLLIIVANIFVAISYDNHLSEKICETFLLVGWIYLVLQIVVILVLMAISLHKFVKAVSKLGGQGNINRSYIIVQILGLFVWTSTWIVEGIALLSHYKQLYREYPPMRNIVIYDGISFFANLFNFMIIAVVIYKSSKVVCPKHDPYLKQDFSLLAYLRNQYVTQ